jgi:hypothetical protein
VSTRTEEVLGDIDGALAAYGTVTRDGADAMRWSPERVICHGTGPLMPERWNVWQHGTYEVRVTADVSSFAAGIEAMQRAFADWARTVWPVLGRAMEAAGKAIAGAYGFFWSGSQLHYHPADAPRRVTRRCRVCHPEAFSPPLAIDGREYHRRQRARRRRRG